MRRDNFRFNQHPIWMTPFLAGLVLTILGGLMIIRTWLEMSSVWAGTLVIRTTLTSSGGTENMTSGMPSEVTTSMPQQVVSRSNELLSAAVSLTVVNTLVGIAFMTLGGYCLQKGLPKLFMNTPE
jgi:hypothetical protein